MGDFTGFSFNGFHSKDLGIVRVSDGDRYKDELTPEFDDATVDIPGGDGIYYFGSYYKSKKFTINIAFDHLTEMQYRKIRRIFSTRKPGTLIYDEAPYKCYKVKLESPISLDTICFDEKQIVVDEEQEGQDGLRVADREVSFEKINMQDYTAPINPKEHTWYVLIDDEYLLTEDEEVQANKDYYKKVTTITREKIYPHTYTDKTERIYKGEGEINLVAYEPFAHAPSKTLAEYVDYDNIEEWKDTSGLKNSLEGYDTYDETDVEYEAYTTQQGDNPQKLKLYVLNGSTYVLTIDKDPIQGTTYYKKTGISQMKVYNPGDIDTPFLLYIPFTSDTIDAFSMTLEEYNEDEDSYIAVEGAQLRFGTITRVTKTWNSALKKMVDIATKNLDDGIIINTKNQLVEGVQKTDDNSYKTTGTLYNNFIEGGNFFTINSSRNLEEYDEDMEDSCGAFEGQIKFSTTLSGNGAPKIMYDYLYF